METVLIILFCVFGASLLSLIILLLTLKTAEPGKMVVVIKDKRGKEPKEAKKAEIKSKDEKPKKAEKQSDKLVLKPIYAAITFGCDKCGQKFLVQEQNLEKDIVCPKCKQVLDKQEAFKKVLKDELKNQTREQELFLGMSYLYGVGVKKDDKKAYLFVNLSAYNGDDVAKQMLQGYYSADIAKLTKENIKDATSEKLETIIKEQKLQLSKVQFEPKTINELHNYAIDYFWWATYHRMNCFDVDELARVGSASINSNRILNMVEGFEEVDLNSLESRLAFAYLDIAANNGRYDLFAELGFAYIGFDNEKAKKYLKKGIECGDERSKELYAVYFEGKTIDQVRIEKLEAPKQVILLEQKPKTSKKTKEKAKAKDADAKAVSAEQVVEVKEEKKAAKKPAAKKAPAKKPAAKKATKATKPAESKTAETKAKVVKKKKPATKKPVAEDKKNKSEILQEIKEKSAKDAKPEEKISAAEKLAQKVEKLEQKVEKLEEKAEEKPTEKKNKGTTEAK